MKPSQPLYSCPFGTTLGKYPRMCPPGHTGTFACFASSLLADGSNKHTHPAKAPSYLSGEPLTAAQAQILHALDPSHCHALSGGGAADDGGSGGGFGGFGGSSSSFVSAFAWWSGAS